MEGWKDGRMEGWTVEALAEIPLRREWKRVIMEEEESRGGGEWNPDRYRGDDG
jgi:hypothetical protein